MAESLEDPEILLTSEAAAKRLGKSLSCLAKWRMSGFGPEFVKLGRSVAYRTKSLDRFISERTRRSTSDPGPTIPGYQVVRSPKKAK